MIGSLLFVALSLPATAYAQDDEDSARALFEEGMQLLSEGEPEAASARFRRSLEAEPRAATAFNLGLALRDAGDHRGAAVVAEALLGDEYGTLDDARSPEVERLLEEVSARLARLEIRLTGAHDAVLSLDGEEVGHVAGGEPLTTWLTPGNHRLGAEVADGPSLQEQVSVEAGERTRLVLHVPDSGAASLTRESALDDDGGSAWLWIGIGGALAVGAAVAIVLVLTAGSGQPTEDLIYGRTFTLGADF